MKHCPNGGAAHKDYYVRVSSQVVQCMYDGCNRPFISLVTEKDKDWEVWFGKKKLTLPTPIEGATAANVIDHILGRIHGGAPGEVIQFDPINIRTQGTGRGA